MNPTPAIKILLIDDEKPIAETIAAYAQKENMAVDHYMDGEKGLKRFEDGRYDIVLLDWMLPGISGIDIIKLIRQQKDTPILMLSARNDEADIVLGLEMGADDYITKPFGPREVIARIHSLLRRHKTNAYVTEKEKDFLGKNLQIFFAKKEVRKNNQTIELTAAEFRILEELVKNIGKVVSRETLMQNALGYTDFLNDRTLDTHIKNLRKKIEDDHRKPKYIKTVREAGFKFINPPQDETAS